jgi:hypothetical protein
VQRARGGIGRPLAAVDSLTPKCRLTVSWEAVADFALSWSLDPTQGVLDAPSSGPAFAAKPGVSPVAGWQEPIVTQGSVNDAMHGAEVKLLGGWGDIVRSWERTR